ncbi:MAG: autotransporter-associated beta strand repeat-containing protein, partial [Phycisphaerae bacterium]|nr:autotransporter-associated beta strand repeat-containing protein [Phycisphaerae bacterium]
MKPYVKSIYHSLISVIVILLLTTSPAWAAFVWNGAATPDTDFDTGGNWVGLAAPAGAVGDSLTFGAAGAGFRTVTGADGAYSTLAGISFDGALGDYSIAGAGSFSFDAGVAITGDSGSTQNLNTIGIVTTGAGIVFAGVDSYTVGGVISGTSITTTTTGTLTLSGDNTYTGVTTISAGTVSVGTIGNGGVAGNLGQATNAVGNLVLDGGT